MCIITYRDFGAVYIEAMYSFEFTNFSFNDYDLYKIAKTINVEFI